MNLSPQWVGVLKQHGFNAVHWSEVGDIPAKDRAIRQWAREHECVVLTHELDFGVMLALTRSLGRVAYSLLLQDLSLVSKIRKSY